MHGFIHAHKCTFLRIDLNYGLHAYFFSFYYSLTIDHHNEASNVADMREWHLAIDAHGHCHPFSPYYSPSLHTFGFNCPFHSNICWLLLFVISFSIYTHFVHFNTDRSHSIHLYFIFIIYQTTHHQSVKYFSLVQLQILVHATKKKVYNDLRMNKTKSKVIQMNIWTER